MALREKHLAEGEHIVLDLRSHWKALAEPMALLVFLLAAIYVARWLTRDSGWSGWVTIVATVLAVVLTVLFVVIPVWRWNTTRYVITNRRIAYRTGILTKRGRDIPLYRINDIQLEKGPVDRLFGCGTLIVSDATEKAGLLMHDVPKVEDVHLRLQELLHATDDGTDDGERPPTEPRRR